jgi:hypothetical protein
LIGSSYLYVHDNQLFERRERAKNQNVLKAACKMIRHGFEDKWLSCQTPGHDLEV